MTLWKPISAALAGLVLIGAAYTTYDQVRPWPTVSAFEQVAGDSYQSQITQVVIWLGNAEDRLSDCRAKRGDCGSLNVRVAHLKAELARLTALKMKHGG